VRVRGLTRGSSLFVEALEAGVPGQKAQDGQKDTENDEDAWQQPFAPALYRTLRPRFNHTDGVKSVDCRREMIAPPVSET